MPADDLTDPAPATTFAHLDATTVLSRGIAELGIYPAVDPLDSTSRMLNATIIGDEHYAVARAVQQVLQVRPGFLCIVHVNLESSKVSATASIGSCPQQGSTAKPPFIQGENMIACLSICHQIMRRGFSCSTDDQSSVLASLRPWRCNLQNLPCYVGCEKQL